jgi:hypothetical protein
MGRKKLKTRKEVAFRLEDVFCPDQDVVLSHLEGGLEVIGKVSFFSDNGTDKEGFAIVDVPGLLVPVVVPRARLRYLSEREPEHKVKKPVAHRL